MKDQRPEWLINPLKRVKQIFDESSQTGEDWKLKVSQTFKEELKQMEIVNQIPILNETPLHKLSTNQVVRFRGMIQDMLDHEFYIDTYKIRKEDGSTTLMPGRYLDITPTCGPNEKIDVSSDCTDERNCYYCISIPGESKWVKEIFCAKNPHYENDSEITTQRIKRSAESDTENENFTVTDNLNGTFADGKKRKPNISMSKSSTSQQQQNSFKNYFPLPNVENGVGCMVKIYDDCEVKLNETIEVIGILSIDPHLVSTVDEESEFSEEVSAHTPPPSLVPRLHCLSLKVLPHLHPDLPSELNEVNFLSPEKASEVRELLGSILDVALLGDGLAAEYLLCHLVSSVYLRQNILPLGKFSLNLSGISKELQDQNYPQMLYEFLEKITTLNYFMPMTLQFMNETDFIPKKDYQSNRLNSGLLQLPSHLHLIVDETKLSAGKLDANGVNNLTSLGQLVSWQKVDYDFQFHPLEQHTDVPVLILSEAKAMISCDCQVSLDAKHTNVSEAFNKVYSMMDEQKLNSFRQHLVLSRMSSYHLTDHMQKKVQEDFVESRKHDDGMSADDLHLLLTLAKLMAQGCGQSELTDDVWRSAKTLEFTRKRRLTIPIDS